MNTSYERENANVYAFPVGGRAGLAARRVDGRPIAELPPRIADVAYGGSWYHEEAVRDERSPKR